MTKLFQTGEGNLSVVFEEEIENLYNKILCLIIFIFEPSYFHMPAVGWLLQGLGEELLEVAGWSTMVTWLFFMDSFHLDTPTFLICHRTKLRKTRKLGLSISFKIRLLAMCCKDTQGERGHWAVNYTSTQSFIRFSYSLAKQLWVLGLNFDWLVQ